MSRPIEPRDLYRLESVKNVALHPDGSTVAFTIGWPDEQTDENRSQIHLHGPDGARRITDGHSDTKPRFSPDGSRLAFLRAEPAQRAQPAVLELGTEVVSIVPGFADDGVEEIRWLDNDRLVALGPRRPENQVGVDDAELARRPRIIRSLDYRFNARGWTHDRKRQIDIADLGTGQLTRVGAPELDHVGAEPAPDGSAILIIGPTDHDADVTGANHVWLAPLDDTEPRRLTEPGGSWRAAGWTTDGRPFAVGSTDVSTITLDRPHLLDRTGLEAPSVLGPHDVNAMSAIGGATTPMAIDGALLGASIRRGAITLDRYDLADNSLTTLIGGDLVVTDFDASSDGSRVVAAISSPTRPAELWQLADGELVKLISLNDDLLGELDLVEPETVAVPSTDGATVEAFITRPPPSAPEAGSLRPGLVFVHGGPLSAYGYPFFDEFQLAAAAGYVVIAGNPRGSDGYGEDWAATLGGRLGTCDWDDVSALADHLSALPEVDSSRIGIGGGSYGGFMTSWAIAQTDRFGAALVERAVISWESFAGTSDIGPRFLPYLLGATIESDIEAVRAQSPITHAASVTTPTLILHSEEDWRCPVEQAEQLFAAYRRNGVDVTLVRFPGEDHELSRTGQPRHRVERFRIVHDFFARHLGGVSFA